MPKHNTPKQNMHLVIGKIYADWCGHCTMMKPEWNKMLEEVKDDMHLIEEKEKEQSPLTSHKKYVSKDGNKVVEVIEIESERVKDELPYIQSHYSPEITEPQGFPTLFKVRDNKVSYYGGERTADKMKKWYVSMSEGRSSGGRISGGRSKTKRSRTHRNKTKKNKTRGRYTRSRK